MHQNVHISAYNFQHTLKKMTTISNKSFYLKKNITVAQHNWKLDTLKHMVLYAVVKPLHLKGAETEQIWNIKKTVNVK